MKIKGLLTIVLSSFAFISVVSAQTQNSIEEQFKSMQINSSPAYVILGVEPENIQRPNSPTDFAANVQSAIVNNKLQPNFAMETTPFFWGRAKADSSKFNVVEHVTSNNYWQNLAKSITFSFATSSSDSLTFGQLNSGTGLGLGMRLQLVQGSVSTNVKDKLMAWFYSSRMKGILDGVISKLEAGSNNSTIDDLDGWLDDSLDKGSYKSLPESEKKMLKGLLLKKLNRSSLSASDTTSMRRIRRDLEKRSQSTLTNVNKYQFPLTREGFMLELAFANAQIAENSSWDNLSNAKTAIWLTPSYRFNVNKDPSVIDFIDIMAVARFTFNSSRVDSTNYIDCGGKLQWTHNRLSLAAEGVLRYLSNKPSNQKKAYTSKTGITFSYKLNELVTFKSTFGSNFDGNSTQYSQPSKMFLVGGFNFAFSSFFPSKK